MLVALTVAAASPTAAPGAVSDVTVTATVPSSTYLAVDGNGAPVGCAPGVASVTSFGTELPGVSAITSSDCSIEFGSSNDSAALRLFQADGLGRAMHAPVCLRAVACYRMDGTLQDSSARANHAAPGASSPSYVPSVRDKNEGLLFDGVNDEVFAPHDTALDLDSFTLDAWLQLSGPVGPSGSSDYVLAKSASDTDRNFVFGINWPTATVARVRADISANGGGISALNGTTDLNDGEWHHIAMVADSAPADPNKSVRVYVDGVLEGTRLFSGDIDNTAVPLSIGNDNTSQTFPGTIDEVRIVPYARTQAELQAYVQDTDGPPDYDDDGLLDDHTWSEGTSMFGACLETASNGASGGAGVDGWPVAGDGNCTTASSAWMPIVPTAGTDGARVAAVLPGPDPSATVTLRFGFRTADDQPPGAYEAPVVFEVVAPHD